MDVRDGHLSCKGNIICQTLTTNANAIINGSTTTQSLITTGNSFMKADGTQSIYFLENGGSSTTSSNRIGRLFGTTGNMYFDFNDAFTFRYYTNKGNGTNMTTILTLNSAGVNIGGSAIISGNVTAPSFNTLSDYRIKDNIIELKETGYTIDSLRPVKYFNKQSQKNDIGLIAHEVQQEFPFLVNGIKDGDEMQSVNYIGLIAVLINEVQEMKKLISELKSKLNIYGII